MMNKKQSTALTVYVLSIGVVNIPTGKTFYNWSIYDNPDGEVYLMNTGCNGYLLYGCEGSLQKGDSVILRDNDTCRKIKESVVTDKCPSKSGELTEFLYRHGYDYKPKKAFRPSAFKSKLMTSYSIKGIS